MPGFVGNPDAGGLLLMAAVCEEVRSLIEAAEGHRQRLEPNADRGRGRGPHAPLSAWGSPPWPSRKVANDIAVVVSGIGRANAAAATCWAIAHAKNSPFDAVLNVGVAGALPGSGLNIGDVIVATESIFVEEGIALPEGPGDMTALGFELGPGPWCRGNRMGADEKFAAAVTHALGRGVVRGPIATVARCSGTDEHAQAVVQQTGALAEAMEGAAVALTAHRLGIHRVAELRIISNTCGDRRRQRWDLSAALRRLDEVLAALVRERGSQPRLWAAGVP